jgi:hypothetical protein
MRLRTIAGVLSAAASAATLSAYARYRKEIRDIRASVERGRTIALTESGPIEYAEAGEGEPMLVIDGAGGGYDQGLFLGAGLGSEYRIIAPSRFGYLKTPVPADSLARGFSSLSFVDPNLLDVVFAPILEADQIVPRHPTRFY